MDSAVDSDMGSDRISVEKSDESFEVKQKKILCNDGHPLENKVVKDLYFLNLSPVCSNQKCQRELEQDERVLCC